ncbi:MAG TPA: hypothetical protein IAA29_07085 [Candidatus Paenibacillus intestinavium]|nr:hypothetical protein [Candidatus Paenibacillus intestinavium]
MWEIAIILLTWFVGISLVIMLVYWIVSSALESSKLATEVNELKQLVQQLINDRENPASNDASTRQVQSEVNRGQCPACGAELALETTNCPGCDLAFLNA